ncbi:hypothetical protein C7S15_4718 [Burkholderia cepacia]|nr:hypothetical protein [Burkholderia cepacia]
MPELASRALDAGVADLGAEPRQHLAIGVVDDADQMFHFKQGPLLHKALRVFSSINQVWLP